MSVPTLLQYLGLNTMQVRCPVCLQVFQTQLKSIGRTCVDCGACGVPLVREVAIQEKPNNLLITVKYHELKLPAEKPKTGDESQTVLKVVSNNVTQLAADVRKVGQ